MFPSDWPTAGRGVDDECSDAFERGARHGQLVPRTFDVRTAGRALKSLQELAKIDCSTLNQPQSPSYNYALPVQVGRRKRGTGPKPSHSPPRLAIGTNIYQRNSSITNGALSDALLREHRYVHQTDPLPSTKK